MYNNLNPSTTGNCEAFGAVDQANKENIHLKKVHAKVRVCVTPLAPPSLALLSHKNKPPTRHPRLSHMIDEYISECLYVTPLVSMYWNALQRNLLYARCILIT